VRLTWRTRSEWMLATVSEMRLVVVAASNAPPTTSRNASPWLRTSQTAPADTPTNSTITANGAASTFSLIEARLHILHMLAGRVAHESLDRHRTITHLVCPPVARRHRDRDAHRRRRAGSGADPDSELRAQSLTGRAE